jgi:hypothetical protein
MEQGALTSCRVQRETRQESKRNTTSEGHSLSIERRGRGKSKQQRKAREREALTNCRAQNEGQVRIVIESQPERSTHVLSGGKVSTLKQASEQRAKETHGLSSADGGTSQDGERRRANEGHSRSVECRLRDTSEP